jgi:hypothetical protein
MALRDSKQGRPTTQSSTLPAKHSNEAHARNKAAQRLSRSVAACVLLLPSAQAMARSTAQRFVVSCQVAGSVWVVWKSVWRVFLGHTHGRRRPWTPIDQCPRVISHVES